MDRLSFVFSLLLIVSVTATLGSVIKAKNPNGEELEALLKRSHDAQAKLKGEKSLRDEDSEMSKQIVVPRSSNRQVTIDLENDSTYTWKEHSISFRYGTADDILPSAVNNGETVHFVVRGKAGIPYTGTSGVFAYYIPSIDKTLAVMWHNPYFHNDRRHNSWNVELYDGDRSADQNMYDEMHSDPFNPNKEHSKSFDYHGLTATGDMSSSGINAALKIRVFLSSS